MKKNNTLTLRGLTKSNVWDLQESDIFMLWANSEKDDAVDERGQHYLDIIASAFNIEEIKVDKPEVVRKYQERGMRVGVIPIKNKEQKWAIKKRPIRQVTDLTYENIHHISAATLLDVIGRNFGGGWDSLNQSIKDIILSGFDISTTTLPQGRMHKPGGLYEMKMDDGFEVLEIPKGTWVEAIFAKAKPIIVKQTRQVDEGFGTDKKDEDEESDVIVEDDYYDGDEDDEELDDEELTEESYRTTIEEDPDQLSLDNTDISDDEY